ncbi:MAG: LysR family transcriptional regulator, partial [Bacteroidetes bacterium]|nr:LysR family transcriptional regulator [Bacteroidota bacterium]
RPLQPTEFCRLLAQEGQQIVKAGQTASRLIAQLRDGRSGAVRLAGTPIFMDGVVSGMLASFQSENPDIRIDQSYGYAADVLARLENDLLDLAIVPIRASEIPKGFTSIRILKGRNVIACRSGHPLARKQPVRLSDITRYPWIAPPADSPLYHDLRAVLEGIGVRDFKVSFTGGSLSAVINVLAGSDSLTVLPYSVVFMLRRQNTLAALSIRIGDPDRHLCILSRTDLAGKPAAKRLARFIEAEFSSLGQVIQRHEQNVLWRM